MTSLTRDPLLAVSKGLLYFLMGALGIGAAACAVALPAILIMHDKVASAIAGELPSVPAPQFITAIAAVLVLAIALLALVFMILLLLKRIVDTVGEGDPFVPQNALRLTRMAWLSLVVQFVSLPLAGIGMWLERVADGDPVDVHVSNGGLSGNGLLLVLVLFILARVFRKGAEMRAELEATV